MKTMAVLLMSISLMGLAGCSHYSEDLSSLEKKMGAPGGGMAVAYKAAPEDIAPAAGFGATGALPQGTLNDFLAREYYALAKYENDKAYDYKASRLYTQKALAASRGEVAVPARVSEFDVTKEQADELNAARAALITVLKDMNAAENAQTLAMAQGRYDCWLERAEEAAEQAHYQACREEFEQAMAALIAPTVGTSATAYEIGFGKNSAMIEPADASTVELIAQFLNAPENAAYTATLNGFTEASAATGFSESLVTTRIKSVRDALVEKGVAGDRLKTGVGVLDNAAQGIPADGTRKVKVVLNAPQPEFVMVPAAASAPYPSSAPEKKKSGPAPVYQTN